MKRKIKFACVAIRSGDEMDCLRCDYPGGGECPVGCFRAERALYVKAIDGGKLLRRRTRRPEKSTAQVPEEKGAKGWKK